MNYVTCGYEPRRALEIFEELCAIPHGSGNERGIADYIAAFADKNGLFCLRDETGNVFVRKNASPGFEDHGAILLQGHMDMVCEKNADSDHDFERDGLDLRVIDGYLWANGTTLGADNGIAVAMMLALLETDEHPALECLFTVEEETGLAGAKGFDCSPVTAKIMINLDSEEEWQITAGCAGGVRTEVDFESALCPIPDGYKTVKISLTGLSGGHSGAEIHCGKTNAIIAMARILSAAIDKADVMLVDVTGGGKDNAIARECFVTVATNDVDALVRAVTCEASGISPELCRDDAGFSVSAREVTGYGLCIDSKTTYNMIAFLCAVKTGVLRMSNQISGLVEYSRNAGIIEMSAGNVKITLSSRSSIEAQLDLCCRELDMLCSVMGAKCRHYSRYPGWEYRPDSKLREVYLSSYKSLFGKDLTVGVIHAGLECGILSEKLGDIDIISVGPNMFDIHSPREHLELASCENVWKTLLAVVKQKI